MRLAKLVGFVLLFAFQATAASAQVWEKFVAPGISYRFEIDPSGPRLIHAVRLSPRNPSLIIVPELGLGRVFADGENKGRETISAMVKRTGALGGVNADFFPTSGDPLGTMVKDRELASAPRPNRSVFGWSPNDIVFGALTFSGAVAVEGSPSMSLDGWNEDAGEGVLMAFAPSAGQTSVKSPCPHAVIQIPTGTWGPNTTVEGVVDHIEQSASGYQISPRTIVLTGSGSKAEWVLKLTPGAKVKLNLRCDGFDWSKIEQAVGGGPNLVTNGVKSIDWELQKFQPGFANNRHPRTLVGRTGWGDILFVIIDGRQPMSVGATLDEAADIMLRLGCESAINLDGGGSSTLNLLGVTLNRPSDGKERPVANGVLFISPLPLPQSSVFQLSAPEKLTIGSNATLKVFQPDGTSLPDSELLWSAMGAGWIDQGGRLQAFAEGACTVTVWVRGQLLTTSIAVEKPPLAAPPKRKAGGTNARMQLTVKKGVKSSTNRREPALQ